MSKTNFDDIQLSTPGIEAAEVNSEAATVGQVLAADGAGGVAWQTRGFVVLLEMDLIYLEESASVDWTDVGLAVAGVPADATAVLLGLSAVDDTNLAGIYFRPNGSTWAGAYLQCPGIIGSGGVEAKGTVVVPCGGGEVEYKTNSTGASNIQVNLLGYWL